MRVFLVQHGQAKPKEEDPDRRLTDQGIADVQRIVAFLQPLKLNLEVIWHSGKSRAEQTAQLLASAVATRQGVVERDGLSPNDPVKPIQKAIQAFDGDVMIVGHLPFLERLAALLVTGDDGRRVVGFQYGAVICLDHDADADWRIAWMMTPDVLRS